MMTVLGIVLAVLIVLNVWFGIYAARQEKERRKKLQERIDEYDGLLNEHLNAMGAMKVRLGETISQLTRQKRLFEELKEKYDALWKEYQKLEAIHGDPHASHQDPVNGGEPSVNTEPGGPANKPDTYLAIKTMAQPDFTELKASYDELAKSYNAISQRYENPSKTYLIRNLAKAYNLKSGTALAKVLGVSRQSISKILRKK